jgi:hypothetical protein
MRYLSPYIFGFSFAEEGGGEAGKSEDAGAEAAGAGDWKTTIVPEDIRQDPIFAKYKEPGEAFRALVGAQKFLGREKLPVPKDANDKETINLILKTLGHPENENGYTLPTDLQIPKDFPLNEELITEFKKVAHQHGILPQQFAGLYKWYMQKDMAAHQVLIKKADDDSKTAENDLRKEYGAAYKQKEALAQKLVKAFADDKAMAELTDLIKGKGNNPGLFRMFVKIAEGLSEDQLSGQPGGLTLTPAEAQSQIKKIKNDMKHPYWVEGHPGHKEAVEEMDRLTRLTMVS